MNGSAGDNRVYGVGNKAGLRCGPQHFPLSVRMEGRYAARQADFDLGNMRQLQLLAESSTSSITRTSPRWKPPATTFSPGSLTGAFPTLTFFTGLKANSTAFGQPLNINSTYYYRERQIQFGLRMRF